MGVLERVRDSLCHWKQWIYTHSNAGGVFLKKDKLEEAIEKMCFSTGWRYRKENGEYIIFR